MEYHICELSALGATPIDWTSPDLTYDESNRFVLRFMVSDPAEELQASQHTYIRLAQQQQCKICVLSTCTGRKKTRI
jgi:hypothetical protein